MNFFSYCASLCGGESRLFHRIKREKHFKDVFTCQVQKNIMKVCISFFKINKSLPG